MAKKNTSITLGERWMDYTRTQVEGGEYDSTSEVIRDALRQALIEGENSGPPKPWNLDSFLAERRLKR